MRTYPVDSEQIGVEDGHPILDNAYTADDLGDVYKTFVTNGVFTNDPNALKVVGSSSDMTVSVYSGKCFIEGRVGNEPLGKDLTVSAAHSTFDRIDTVVARWDGNRDVQSIDLFIVEGAPQSTPQRPTLTRNDTVYEIGLADVLVTAGSTTIDNIRITDTRLDPNRCGSVSLIQPLDTTSFMEQLDGIISDVEQAYDDAISGTLAGEMQNGIDDINDSIANIEKPGWVDTDRIGDKKVTTAKVADKAVTTAKIDDKAVGAGQLADAVNPSSIIKTVNCSIAYSLTAGQETLITMSYTCPNGYAPISVKQIKTQHSYVLPSGYDLNTTGKVLFYVKNYGGGVSAGTAVATVVCIKNL